MTDYDDFFITISREEWEKGLDETIKIGLSRPGEIPGLPWPYLQLPNPTLSSADRDEA